MIRHFFLDKTNSIISSSLQNTGLNPVLHIGYGREIMRGLIHFDEKQIKDLIDDKTFADSKKVKYTLNMTNCFSIDGLPYEKTLIAQSQSTAKRACSFDLILFKLPCHFDMGRGFDFVSDFWVHDGRSFSEEGSNWYFARTGIPWTFVNNKTEEDYIDTDADPEYATYEDESGETREIRLYHPKDYETKTAEGGIYPASMIMEEYSKFINGEESIIIGQQHFDFGDENLRIDITDYVNDVIDGKINNYGLCLAFVPQLEALFNNFEQYVGFVTDTTNTFFHPYVEADYPEAIMDDSFAAVPNRANNFYLYASDNGTPVNLDELPSCTIDGIEGEVSQVTKGVYKAHFEADKCDFEPESIIYYKWSGMALDGVNYGDCEYEANTTAGNVSFSSNSGEKADVAPTLSGINDDEKLNRGEVREIVVDFRKKYETNKRILVSSADYRLYVKDGNRQIDVISYQPIEMAGANNFFMVYTQDLVPNDYHIDVRVKCGRETKFYKDVLRFTVVSDVTERYQ